MNACTNQLGMKDGNIRDDQITSSSEHDANHGASNARLDRDAGGGRTGSWSARNNDLNQWIQVDFGTLTSVSGVTIQGRQESDQWVTSYKVMYSYDNIQWKYITDDNIVPMVSNVLLICISN